MVGPEVIRRLSLVGSEVGGPPAPQAQDTTGAQRPEWLLCVERLFGSWSG